MNFIMNPPYGRASSISRKVVNSLFENFEITKLICLAPKKSNYDHWRDLENIKGPYSLSTMFKIVECNDMDLYISYYTKQSLGSFSKSLAEVLLNEKQLAFYKAVQKYNTTHQNNFVLLKELTEKTKEEYSKYNENFIFEIPLFTPANGIQLGGQSGNHNLKNEPIEWRASNTAAPYALFCNTKNEFDNFSKWYYNCPYSWSRKRKKIECVMDLTLSILFIVYGAGPSILKYKEVWPNLDWTQEWTDEKIINELKIETSLSKDWSLN